MTKPIITVLGTNRMSFATPSAPSPIWTTPVRIVAASRYSTPWSLTSETITRAIAPVAAEIMAGPPPANEVTMTMTTEA